MILPHVVSAFDWLREEELLFHGYRHRLCIFSLPQYNHKVRKIGMNINLIVSLFHILYKSELVMVFMVGMGFMAHQHRKTVLHQLCIKASAFGMSVLWSFWNRNATVQRLLKKKTYCFPWMVRSQYPFVNKGSLIAAIADQVSIVLIADLKIWVQIW